MEYGVIIGYGEQNADDYRRATLAEATALYDRKIAEFQRLYPEETESTGQGDLDMGKTIQIPVFITTLPAHCLGSYTFETKKERITVQLYRRTA